MTNPNFKLTAVNQDGNYAEIIIEPLDKGYGHTMGNALRRVLLSGLEGAAATQVKLDGVSHQFSTLSGMKENIVDFILNLKNVYFQMDTDGSAAVKIDVKGKKTITAKDLICPAGVTVTNPDHVLASLTSPSSKLKGVITVEKGVGYSSAEEHNTNEIGVIPVDSIFTPVLRTNYTVEATRVGRRVDLDRVHLTVETNGTIAPEDTVKNAAKILTEYFTQVYNPTFTEEEKDETSSAILKDEQMIEELGLATRVTNALKKGGFYKLTDFSEASYADLLKVKNLGEKSVKQIVKKLENKGIKVAK